jgi:hypothetical protein
VQDEVIFTSTRNEQANIRVYDITGKEIFSVKNVQLDGFRLSTHQFLQKGIYILTVDNQNFTQSIKVVKQ